MTSIHIKNGFVVDPGQGIHGDKKDIFIENGKIVKSLTHAEKTIDASGMVVMAGGVDIHSHVAGAKVNVGRNFRPEDKLQSTYEPYHGIRHMAGGTSVPTVFKTAYTYADMGYTTVIEAAMPPLYARHTHEEMRDTPILDEAALPMFGNNWFILDYLKRGEIENAAAYAAWLLRATKGYGIKCVNPGGTEAWAWGLNCLSIDDPVPYFDITPKQIVSGLMEVNESLHLPHSLHLHSNNLGNPGNYTTTLDTLKLSEGIKPNNNFNREQVLHHTHIQFHSYGGTTWADFESKGKEVMDYINNNPTVTCDIGFVTLDETTTMTGDGPFEYHLNKLNHLKWANTDVELECGSGIVPYVYSKDVYVCGVQWSIGLEMALLAKDHMRCHLTTDHPNAGPFWRYPRVMKWLMSEKARNDVLASMKNEDKVRDRSTLGSIDRELTLYEIAQMTRAGPAKALGLSSSIGSLTPGMQADVAVYPYNPETESDPEKIEWAFSHAKYLIKSGEIILNDGELVSNGNKKTYWVDVTTKPNRQVERDIDRTFVKYYTVTKNNYEVTEHEFMKNPCAVKIDAVQ
jgi:formylmethanofuran dehydrogenase subunit A